MENMTNMMQHPNNATVDLTNENVDANRIIAETPGKNYRPMGATIPADLREEDIKMAAPATPNMERIAAATGQNIDPSMLKMETEKPYTPAEPVPVSQPSEGLRFMSPAKAKDEGIDTDKAENIDIRQEVARRNKEQWEQAQKVQDENLSKMLQGAVDFEAARNQRLENTLNADEETRSKLLGDTPVAATARKTITTEDRAKDERKSGNPAIDPYELMPSYDEEQPVVPEAEDTTPDPNSDEYAEFIRGLETVTVPEPEKGYAVTRIREANVTLLKTNPNKSVNNLGNQAFSNAVANYKRDNFSKVTVPLVNSGFLADVVGTGVVDLQNLYLNVDENMSTQDYQLEQMATVIRNVVGTNPRINPMQLRNSIHFQDYDMLAYGHICATLKTVETVANCSDCGKPFHITSNPANLLINMDELYEKRCAIENAANVEENSLMTTTRLVTTSVGVDVTLAHPSYAELVRAIRGYQEYSEGLTAADQHRFTSMLNSLYMIRKVRLPNGIESNNIYQHYMALMLLGQRDLELVQREIEDMRKDIIVPKFGIREVECPHCHRINRNIPYNNLLELLFFHVSVDAYLNPENGKKTEQAGSET